MTETVAPVSAWTPSRHLDCTRTYIGKLEAKGVIQRQGDGFPLDRSRVAYLRYLRRERRQSPRAEAARAKAALLTINDQFTQRLYLGVRPATLPVSGSNIRQLVYECPSLQEWTTAPQLRQVKEPELLSSALCCVAW